MSVVVASSQRGCYLDPFNRSNLLKDTIDCTFQEASVETEFGSDGRSDYLRDDSGDICKLITGFINIKSIPDRKSEMGSYPGVKENSTCVHNEEKSDGCKSFAPRARKVINIVDLGAGKHFGWCRKIARYIENFWKLPEDLLINIFAITGDVFPGRTDPLDMYDINFSKCKITVIYNFKIECLHDELIKRRVDLVDKVHLLISVLCFLHLVDPLGTFVQAYNLLLPEHGVFIFDRHALEETIYIKPTPLIYNINNILLNASASPINDGVGFSKIIRDENKCMVDVAYGDNFYNQIGGYYCHSVNYLRPSAVISAGKSGADSCSGVKGTRDAESADIRKKIVLQMSREVSNENLQFLINYYKENHADSYKFHRNMFFKISCRYGYVTTPVLEITSDVELNEKRTLILNTGLQLAIRFNKINVVAVFLNSSNQKLPCDWQAALDLATRQNRTEIKNMLEEKLDIVQASAKSELSN